MATNKDQESCESTLELSSVSSLALEAPGLETPGLAFDTPRGWLVCAGVFIINIALWGSNTGFAVYLAHYLRDDTLHTLREMYGLIGGLLFGFGLCFASLITYSAGRFGVKTTVACGVVVQATATLLALFATSLWQVLLTQGFANSVGMVMVGMPCFPILLQWFRRHRTVALGIATGGIGLGGIMFNLLLLHVVNRYGVHWALRVQCCVCLALAAIAFPLIQDRNHAVQPELRVVDRQALRSGGWWVACTWANVAMLGYMVLLYNLADYTVLLGYTPGQGAVVLCLVNTGLLFGRPAVGILADYVGGPVTVVTVVHAVVVVLCFGVWLPTHSFGATAAFAVLVGLTFGAMWPCIGPIHTQVVGLRKSPCALAMQWAMLGLVAIAAPVIGVVLRQAGPRHHQYRWVVVFVGCCYAVSAGCLLVLRGWLLARDAEEAGGWDTPTPVVSAAASPKNTAQDHPTLDSKLHLHVPAARALGMVLASGTA